jgi:BirA family transcriptional regulator, biotin operon repressor / biotin---[acetyl-CoA-carboxylase] ligase
MKAKRTKSRPKAKSAAADSSYDLHRLRREIKPFRVHFFSRLGSTNTHAAVLRKRGDLYAPAVVITPHQTAGRGRGTNTWFSSPGCLTVTFAFPIDERLEPHQLPLVAGLAVRNAAAELTDFAPIQLKWPNDIVHEDRKLAGLLCERVGKVDLIGLGLNVNLSASQIPAPLRGRATSLAVISGRPFDMTTVLATIAGHLHRTLQSRSVHTFTTFRAEYDQHHSLLGRRLKVVDSGDDAPVNGQCVGISGHVIAL